MLLFTQYKTISGLPLSAVSLSLCITCQDVCVQQGSHLVISNKPRLHTKKHLKNKPRLHIKKHMLVQYNKNPESLCYEQKHTRVLILIKTVTEY